MYAVVGWLALCVERTKGIMLRASLEVELWMVVRSTVEPTRPS